MHIILCFQTHEQSVQHRIKKIEQLNRQAAIKAGKNSVVEQQLPEMQVTVAERRHIYKAIGNNKITNKNNTLQREPVQTDNEACLVF